MSAVATDVETLAKRRRNHRSTGIPTGRPKVIAAISEEKQKLLFEAIGVGTPYEVACDYAGVSDRTVFRLLSAHEIIRDAAEKEALKNTGSEENWPQFIPDQVLPGGHTLREEAAFCHEIKRAVARCHVRWAQNAENPPKNSFWQAWMTKLERRYPDLWGRRDTIVGDPDRPVSVGIRVYVPDNGRGPKADNRNVKKLGHDAEDAQVVG
jgi:hypothetical protein